MTNPALAGFVAELADLMALDGTGPQRIAHYRRAATAIRRFEHPLSELIEAGTDLTRVPGIGRGLAGVLEDLVLRGSSSRLEEYRDRIPAGLPAVMRLDGVGATRARTMHDAGVDSPEKLREAIADRTIYQLDGFGPGVVSRLRRAIAARAALAGKSLLSQADRTAASLAASLRSAGIEPRLSGEVRRRTEIVSTVDVVCEAGPEALWDATSGLRDMRREGSRGDNPILATYEGVKIRLVAAPPERAEAVTHHLTGPPPYIEALVDRARQRGLQLTPTGIAVGSGADADERAACGGADPITDDAESLRSGETGIYERLDLPWIAPEIREDASTVERAESELPRLVTCGDIRGDLHMHTTWSDGAATLRRMVEAAAAKGYSYVAITDHSPSTGVPSGLDAGALRAQSAEIARVQEELPEIRIWRGCEVDILRDGSLDLDDDTIGRLDLVLASVHSSFDMTEARMTARIIRAMENPFVDLLCHPTGRKLGRRPPYPLDLEEVVRAAAALDVAVEINGSPRRLDLDHRGLRLCGRLGAKVAITSDAHSVARLDNIRYGVDQARRGWLQANQIVNAGSLGEVSRWIARRRG